MLKTAVIVSFVVLCIAPFALAKMATYGTGEWAHCSEPRVSTFTLQKGAWRCESLAGMKAADHGNTDSFQEPDCYRGATPIPVDGGIKEKNGGLETAWTKRIVSFCFAGEGLYARRCDFAEGECKESKSLSDEELRRIFK